MKGKERLVKNVEIGTMKIEPKTNKKNKKTIRPRI